MRYSDGLDISCRAYEKPIPISNHIAAISQSENVEDPHGKDNTDNCSTCPKACTAIHFPPPILGLQRAKIYVKIKQTLLHL